MLMITQTGGGYNTSSGLIIGNLYDAGKSYKLMTGNACSKNKQRFRSCLQQMEHLKIN